MSAIIAAVVAAVVATIGIMFGRMNADEAVRVSRETARLNAQLTANVKIAEMRQIWINTLRDAMCDLLSLAVSGDCNNGPSKTYSLIGTKIELLMNPNDIDYGQLRASMDRLLGIETGEEAQTRNEQFVAVCQTILKREWDVLKGQIASVVDFPPPGRFGL